MVDIRKRGLESLLSQNSQKDYEQIERKKRFTKTIGFEVTDKQYKTYKRYSKYFGSEDLIKKWCSDIDRIEQDRGRDMDNIGTETRNRLIDNLK